MKTVVLLAGLVAVALGGTVPQPLDYVSRTVDADFASKQEKILAFFWNAHQLDTEAEYYKVGKDYDIQANIDNYTEKEAVTEFLKLWKTGFTPKYEIFSILYERMEEEAEALYYVFLYAKDFDTFYKTAAFARVYLNPGQLYYALYMVFMHRPDTQGLILPPVYEVFPEYFTNADTIHKAYRIKMQDGIFNPEVAKEYGIVKESDKYIFYSNYSNYWTYDNEEQRLAYFTEDVGMNAYYYYFQAVSPSWLEKWGVLKDRLGEIFYFQHQQLLARYYLNRLSNGLGEIPDFSWYHPIKNGYVPFLSVSGYPFIQRQHYYQLRTEDHFEELRFLDTYEKTFVQYLQRGQFKAFNQEVDLRSSKAVNFVSQYWQSNVDLFEKTEERNYYRSYETIARKLLSGAPHPLDKHTIAPTALSFSYTSLRDPVFYQLYSKILGYVLQYKEYLEPYNQKDLHFSGVKISDVTVDKLVTFFDFYEYDITNAVYDSKTELKEKNPAFKVRQPRLDHKKFSVNIDIKSEVETEVVIKIFLGPKYNSNGYPISIEDNWMNFVALDWFNYKLKSGQNKVERNSDEFWPYQADPVPTAEVAKLLEQSKVPAYMATNYEKWPKRFMLPKGTDGGFPYQLFVFVYPREIVSQEFDKNRFMIDNKPFGYPFDRPAKAEYFVQPNIFFKDVSVYFEGEHFTYSLNNPFYTPRNN